MIAAIDNREEWERFLLRCEEKTFLHSWSWGEFRRKEGEKIWRLGLYEGKELIAVVFATRIKARRGTFLFVPHGPVLEKGGENCQSVKREIIKTLLSELGSTAKREGASFIRLAPVWKQEEENIKIFRELGFRDAPTHLHPEVTWELNILPSEDDLFAGMRKTTRYLIRQAQKNKNIEILQSKNINDTDLFYRLHRETVDRHHFVPFSLDYMKREFESFQVHDEIAIFFGKYCGELVASAIIIFWQEGAFYHHGATSLRYSKIPVSYLLQWEAIREAKRRGCRVYNFWGIAPDQNKHHPWAGLTLFKTGFGGYKKEYVKTKDFPLSWRYWPTAIFELLRRKKRGL